MHHAVSSFVCLEEQSCETVFNPVGLVVSRLEGGGRFRPTLGRLTPLSPVNMLIHYFCLKAKMHKIPMLLKGNLHEAKLFFCGFNRDGSDGLVEVVA